MRRPVGPSDWQHAKEAARDHIIGQNTPELETPGDSYAWIVPRRVLDIAVCGAEAAEEIVQAIAGRGSRLLAEMAAAASLEVHHFAEPDEEVAAAHHLVVSSTDSPSRWSDVTLASIAEAERLAEGRLVPWASRWQQGRRAQRTQVALLSGPDPSWAPTAHRLIARLDRHLADLDVLRIDHIGSTSVDGLAAKDLIDIQVMVGTDAAASSVAEAATGAGFVHVTGQWHGKDRNGDLHPEQVCVDADPGRPVNINVRSATRPVARDALLFRDWLRTTPDGRSRYLAVKSGLAGRQVDDYGDSKEPFISAALREADTWASETGWAL